ncbi:hypothetical protein [Leptolyngbya sp. GB1-A1]
MRAIAPRYDAEQERQVDRTALRGWCMEFTVMEIAFVAVGELKYG